MSPRFVHAARIASYLFVGFIGIFALPCALARAGERTSSGWLSTVETSLRRLEYQFTPLEAGVFAAPNRAHELRSRVSAHGLEVSPRAAHDGEASPAWRITLATGRFGRESTMRELDEARLHVTGARATLAREALDEWFENTERGIEHGWTIQAPPLGEERDALWIGLDIGGDLCLSIAEDGSSAVFVDARGEIRARYAELHAFDADGCVLAATLMPSPTGPGIRVDTRGATYPLTIDPILSGPAWTAESNQAQAKYGASVATAGDVNGDGFSDVIVGAQWFDAGQAEEGRAFVYLGSPSGPSASPAWTAESDQGAALFGFSVATAGDVDGDGFGDVIVGAPFASNGEMAEGRAFVYRGSATGLAATASWTAESNQAQAHLGVCVAPAGDVNNDGFDDVAIGAPEHDAGQTDEGRALVYPGSSTGLLALPIWSDDGEQDGATFGYALAGAGDVNADGFGDLVVGARSFDSGNTDEGRAYLYTGNILGLTATPAWSAEGNADFAFFAESIAPAGDVDGDGYADVIVGAPFATNGETQEGRAFVYSGNAGGLSSTPAWTGESDQMFARYGHALATAGDVNGDGFADVIVGSPYSNANQIGGGRAWMYLGGASGLALSAAWTVDGTQVGENVGWSVAPAGDANGDGFGDVIVGAPGFDGGETDEGRASVFFGVGQLPSTTPTLIIRSHDGDIPWFGYSMAVAGDVDGDGFDDVIIGAHRYDHGEPDEGLAFVYRGSPSGLSDIPAWTAEFDVPGGFAGWSVGGAGDVNGDGYSDVGVGVYATGIVYVFHGSAGGLATTPSWIGQDQSSTPYGAWACTGVGDVDGDGYGDFMVVTEVGNTFYLFHGSASGLSQSPAWTYSPPPSDYQFLRAASAGDVNGDGFGDVVVSSHSASSGELHEGLVFVFHGAASGLATTPALMLEGNQAAGEFGSSVASAGDVNLDGYGDVLVGAFYWSNDQSQEGRAFLYLGSSAGLSPAIAWTAESDVNYGFMGWAVASGDVNADGFSDLVVSANEYWGTVFNEGRVYVYLGSSSGPPATASWFAQSGFYGATMGDALAVCDVNGDGFDDIAAGASRAVENYLTEVGRVYVFHGGPSGALSRVRQRRSDDAAPIALLGRSESTTGFRIKALANDPSGLAGSPAGRTRARLEWEVKEQSTVLNGAGLQRGATFADSGALGASVELSEIASGLAPARRYHWRARIASRSPFFPHGRWLDRCGNALTDVKLRTGPDCNLNGIDDRVDIATGASTDLDSNGAPDECQSSVPFCFGDGSDTACPCGNTGASGHGCASSVSANGGLLETSGDPSVFADTLVLLGSEMPNSSALYFQGTAFQNGGAGATFGDGLRCASGSVIRLGTKINAGGASQYPQGGDPLIHVKGMVPSGGGMRTYQCWYRNAASFCTPSTFNLTNGVRVQWSP